MSTSYHYNWLSTVDAAYGVGTRPRRLLPASAPLHRPSNAAAGVGIRCSSSSSSSDSNSDSASSRRRGFGAQPTPTPPPDKPSKASTAKGAPRQRKSTSQQPGTASRQAPPFNSRIDGTSTSIVSDLQFEERLEAVRRSAMNQKKTEEKQIYGAIDYDSPVESEPSTIGVGTKIGVGVAVIVFGLVFALGDFLPSSSISPNKDTNAVNNTLSPEEKTKLQTRLQQYEETLNISPEDSVAREGAAVTLTELGEYSRAASMLEDLTKSKPSDPEAFRLLGEVKYEMKDYEGSAAAYRSSAMVSKKMDFEVLRGLTNALLAAKKPEEAVQVLLASRDRLDKETSNKANIEADGSVIDAKSQVDSFQVELLLGKAYSEWGHISDAVSVYDQLIASHPDDFRGYLAKGIVLKGNGMLGDAERMFIQARFFAPEGAKAIVDRYARQ